MDTLVSDSMDQATEASAGIATASPDTPGEAADQARALDLVDDAVRALAATRAYLEDSFVPALPDGGEGPIGEPGPAIADLLAERAAELATQAAEWSP